METISVQMLLFIIGVIMGIVGIVGFFCEEYSQGQYKFVMLTGVSVIVMCLSQILL